MTRLAPRWGAAALVAVASAYLVLALTTGHSAASTPAAELSAPEAALGAHPAAALLVREQGHVAVVDVRPADRFAAYHLPTSVNAPGVGARGLLAALGPHAVGLIVAADDDAATRLVAEARALDAGRRLHFLRGGARAFYLAFELPVPLFTDAPPPHGYRRALGEVREWLAAGQTQRPARVLRALGELASEEYGPTDLGAKRAAAKGAGKRKVSGGCG